MTLMSLGLCISMLLGSQQMAVPKQIGAPASDLLNNRLRSPDPATIGRPFGHAMLDITFDTEGQWHYDVPIPPTAHLSLLPVGPGCETWNLIATNPRGQTDGDNRTRTEGSLQPFFPATAERLDIANPMVGTWRITIQGGQPGDAGQLIVRDRSGTALQLHPTSHVALVGHPIVLRSALATVDRSGSPLQDALDGLAGGLDIISAQVNWRDARGDHATFELVHNGPWLEHSYSPTTRGPHQAHLQVTGIDADGHTFIRTAYWHCNVETEVAVTGIEMRAIDDERLAMDLQLEGANLGTKVLLGAEVWCEGEDGLRPRCWIGGMATVTQQKARLILDTRWLAVEGGNGQNLQLREVRVADPNGARPLLPAGALDSILLGNVEVPASIQDPMAILSELQHGQGDQPGFATQHTSRDSGYRADQYGGHNLMLSHGYCSDGDSFPPSDFTGDVAVYFNPDQNFSHDQFALDILSFGWQYKSFGLVGHSQGGNAAVHLFTFYWSGLDWASPGRLLQAMGTPFSGTTLAGNVSVLGELFGFGCGVNYDMTYDGAAVWLSYIPTSTRERTWTWTSTFEDEWWSYDYCHILTDLLLWDPDDGVVENSEGDLDGANNMGTTIGWCHIQDMADPAEVWDTNRTGDMNAEGAR